jgi:hypothetical protein
MASKGKREVEGKWETGQRRGDHVYVLFVVAHYITKPSRMKSFSYLYFCVDSIPMTTLHSDVLSLTTRTYEIPVSNENVPPS